MKHEHKISFCSYKWYCYIQMEQINIAITKKDKCETTCQAFKIIIISGKLVSPCLPNKVRFLIWNQFYVSFINIKQDIYHIIIFYSRIRSNEIQINREYHICFITFFRNAISYHFRLDSWCKLYLTLDGIHRCIDIV